LEENCELSRRAISRDEIGYDVGSETGDPILSTAAIRLGQWHTPTPSGLVSASAKPPEIGSRTVRAYSVLKLRGFAMLGFRYSFPVNRPRAQETAQHIHIRSALFSVLFHGGERWG
jgi:hypothetical protein